MVLHNGLGALDQLVVQAAGMMGGLGQNRLKRLNLRFCGGRLIAWDAFTCIVDGLFQVLANDLEVFVLNGDAAGLAAVFLRVAGLELVKQYVDASFAVLFCFLRILKRLKVAEFGFNLAVLIGDLLFELAAVLRQILQFALLLLKLCPVPGQSFLIVFRFQLLDLELQCPDVLIAGGVGDGPSRQISSVTSTLPMFAVLR